MLEDIIVKLVTYLGDNYGLDWKDLKDSVGLDSYQIESVKELIEEAAYL
jgi:hypothetical protein